MTAVSFTLRTMHLPKLKENPYRLSQLAMSLEILVQQFGTFALTWLLQLRVCLIYVIISVEYWDCMWAV